MSEQSLKKSLIWQSIGIVGILLAVYHYANMSDTSVEWIIFWLLWTPPSIIQMFFILKDFIFFNSQSIFLWVKKLHLLLLVPVYTQIYFLLSMYLIEIYPVKCQNCDGNRGRPVDYIMSFLFVFPYFIYLFLSYLHYNYSQKN